jgi:uncharacterized membrane protein YkvA (DUF1232 family)
MNKEISKCNFCDNDAEFKLEGVAYCKYHFIKNSKTSTADYLDLVEEPKKGMKVLCKSCNTKFFRTSKRGKLCQFCIDKSRRDSINRMRAIREREKKEISRISILKRFVEKKPKDQISQEENKSLFIESQANKITKAKDYYNLLSNSVQNYQGYEGIMTNLPSFYQLLCKISSDKKCPWSAKMLINAVISNLVLESDIIDDSIGPEGYLDDLYLCAYVLKEIRDRISKEIILDNLDDSSDKKEMLKKIYEVYEKSSFYLGTKTKQILNHVGIDNFKSFDYLYKDVTTYHLDKLKNKLMLLYAMLAVKINKKSEGSQYEDSRIKRHIEESPYFSEISRYIQFIE